MLYECERCGKKVKKTISCSAKCRLWLHRHKNETKHDKPLYETKRVILPALVKKSEKKIKEIRYDNPFEMCKKHSVYKRSCGCKQGEEMKKVQFDHILSAFEMYIGMTARNVTKSSAPKTL